MVLQKKEIIFAFHSMKEDINSRTVWFGTFIFVFVRSERLGGWVSIIVRQMIA